MQNTQSLAEWKELIGFRGQGLGKWDAVRLPGLEDWEMGCCEVAGGGGGDWGMWCCEVVMGGRIGEQGAVRLPGVRGLGNGVL